MRQLALDFTRLPQPTLDNFIAGRNAELLQSLRRLPERGAGERFLYLWGVPGSGRSHLLRGAVAALHAQGMTAAFVACAPGSRFAEGLERMDCVAVDDVERLDAPAQIGLFNLYNLLRDRQGMLLVSGDVPPARLALRPDLVTRLGWGLVYEVHALSDEEKAQALKEHAATRGFTLSDEVCGYLLNRARRDMPSLLALLEALDRHSLEAKRPVSVALARELLQACAGGAECGTES